MVFPATALPVTVQIAPGANPAADPGGWAWTDVTSSVRLLDGITISQGRADEARKVDAGTCRLRFDNVSGDFTPRNPLGQWYGLLSKNTPLRVRIRRVVDTFTRTVSNGWGAADSEQVWTTSGGAASDYSVSSGAGRHSLGTVAVARRSLLAGSLADGEILTQVTVPVLITGQSLEVFALARYVDANNFLKLGFYVETTNTITLVMFKRVGGVDNFVSGTTFTVPGITHFAGASYNLKAQLVGSQLKLKVWLTTSNEPGWYISATDSSLTGAGQVGVHTMLGAANTNTLPVVLSFDNFQVDVDRFSGFVAAWPPRWDLSGKDATVPVDAVGILGRLQQGNPPTRSPLRRFLAASSPLAYWPCEDAGDATQAASAVPGQPPMAVAGSVAFGTFEPEITFGGTFRYGTAKLPNLAGGGSLTAPVPPGASSPVEWAVQFAAKNPDTETLILAEWTTPGGSYVRWEVVANNATSFLNVIAYDSAGTPTTVVSEFGITTSFTFVRVDARQNGTSIDVRLYTTGILRSSATIVTNTLAAVQQFTANPANNALTQPFAFGHVIVHDTRATPVIAASPTDGYGVLVGDGYFAFITETAHDRLARLCAEDGLTLSVPAVDAEYVTRMGSQPDGVTLDLYQQCADADQGVIYESGFGLGYLPRGARYNPPVTLALDAAQQLGAAPEPTDDDQQLRNRWKVTRIGGSSATAEDPASIATVGSYEDSIDVNLYNDPPLADHAAWRVHLGTVDEMRWPRITLNLAATPELIDQVLSCQVGARLTAANPPTQVAGDDIDVIVEGWSETLGFKDWDVVLNCSPTRPWQVAVLDASRLDSGTSTLTSGITSSATSVSVTTSDPLDLWTTDGAQMPFGVLVGGEKMTVTAVSGATSPQTFTVTRSANGIVKAHSAGAAVHVADPAVLAL